MAWDEYQRGRALEIWGGRRRLAPSLAHFRRAIEADPGFTQARIALAFRLLDGIRNCWIDQTENALSEADNLVDKIRAATPDDFWARALIAFLECAHGRFDEGLAIMQEVARKHPETTEVASCLGAIYDYSGDCVAGARYHRYALTLTDYPPNWVRSNLALSLMIIGDPLAEAVASDLLSGDPDNLRGLMVKAVCLQRRSDNTGAQGFADQMRAIDPAFTATRWRSPRFFAIRQQYERVASELQHLGF